MVKKMKVKEYVEKLIKQEEELYGKRYKKDGIIYKEVSSRFPNGKKILCGLGNFIDEFGERDMDDDRSRRFHFLQTTYEIIKSVSYEREKRKMIEDTPIIVGKNYAIEMKSYKRELEKGCLLRSPFENDYREW